MTRAIARNCDGDGSEDDCWLVAKCRSKFQLVCKSAAVYMLRLRNKRTVRKNGQAQQLQVYAFVDDCNTRAEVQRRKFTAGIC